MYSCGRSEQYFPDADHFYPDRWLRTNNGSKFLAVNDINACLPYAKGNRSCIGRKMSAIQLSTVIKKVSREYKKKIIYANKSRDFF